MRFSMLALFGWVLVASGLLGCMAALVQLLSEDGAFKYVPPDTPPEEKLRAAKLLQDSLSLAIRAGTGGMASFVVGCGLLMLNWRQKRREARRERSGIEVLTIQEQDDG